MFSDFASGDGSTQICRFAFLISQETVLMQHSWFVRVVTSLMFDAWGGLIDLPLEQPW